VHVVRDRAHVVEELAEQVPALLALHHRRSDQEIAGRVDGILQQKPRAVFEPHVTQALVGGGAGTVVGIGRRREPALVDAAAVAAKRVEIARVQLQPLAGDHERARHPARLEPQQALSGGNGVLDLRAIDHQHPRFGRSTVLP
jgi:hypothetical protein